MTTLDERATTLATKIANDLMVVDAFLDGDVASDCQGWWQDKLLAEFNAVRAEMAQEIETALATALRLDVPLAVMASRIRAVLKPSEHLVAPAPENRMTVAQAQRPDVNLCAECGAFAPDGHDLCSTCASLERSDGRR